MYNRVDRGSKDVRIFSLKHTTPAEEPEVQ